MMIQGLRFPEATEDTRYFLTDTCCHDIDTLMEKELGSDIAEGIAEALKVGATLMVRHLARGTSLTSINVLAALAAEGPSRLTALATATGIAQPAMTQLVGRMDREGLVVRLIDPEDGRATLVAITDAGRALRSERHQSAHERMAELLDRLSADDQAMLALAMRVAMPMLQQLTRDAAEHPQSEPAATSLIT
jgi:DNA-binding MarR family transcriptional regulator